MQACGGPRASTWIGSASLVVGQAYATEGTRSRATCGKKANGAEAGMVPVSEILTM
jgi:hypothetical protein